MSARRTRRLTTITAVASLLVLTSALTALAGHQFSDVAAHHPFHAEISKVADAGITTGYPDGTFRPGNTVTRQAAAAFTARSAGHATASRRATMAFNSSSPAVYTVQVAIPGAAGGTGHLKVDTAALAYNGDSSCPCVIATRIQVASSSGTQSSFNMWETNQGGVSGVGGYISIPNTYVFTVPTGETVDVTLRTSLVQRASGTSDLLVDAAMTTMYAPFTSAVTHVSPASSSTASVSADSADGPNSGQ